MINVYMYKQDLSLNNRRGLVCHKTQPTKKKATILGAWDHRLNYDVHSFTTERRMTEEDALLSDNFWLCLKHWKFEMCSYNLHLKNRNYLYSYHHVYQTLHIMVFFTHHIELFLTKTKIKNIQPYCLGMEAYYTIKGAHGVMVIVVGYGHGDTSSNPGRDWLHFT